MKFAKEHEVILKNQYAVYICQGISGAIFSPSGGWYINKDDDFYFVFETLEKAQNWSKEKAARSHDIIIYLFDSKKNIIEEYYSTPILKETKKRLRPSLTEKILTLFGYKK